jgi:hypothetical protein
MEPKNVLMNMGLRILRYDDDLLKAQPDKEAYINDQKEYASMPFKLKKDPSNGWAVPFVTGHKYKIHWGMTGLDFTDAKVDLSEYWLPTDKSIYLVHNVTDIRAKMDVTVNGDVVEDDTIPVGPDVKEADYIVGQNKIFTEKPREFHFIVNGRFKDPLNKEARQLKFKAHRCIGPCFIEDDDGPEPPVTKWSDTEKSWEGISPSAGNDIIILKDKNIELDLKGDTPIFGTIEIRSGILRFANDQDITLHCSRIFVNEGKFGIGTKSRPYNYKGGVTFHGRKGDDVLAISNDVEAGSKMIANIGNVKLFGTKRANKMSRLTAEVYTGATTMTVEKGLDWRAGDELGLLPTSYVITARDKVKITEYNTETGAVTFDPALKYYHFGAAESTAAGYDGLDMRGEVVLLTRNLKI